MVQKVIKIGDSIGVTIPKKQAEELGIGVGDNVEFELKRVKTSKQSEQTQLLKDLEHFMATYDEDLKRLAQR